MASFFLVNHRLIAFLPKILYAMAKGGGAMQAVKTGALIAEARKEKNLTQKDLAQALHVSVQAVSKWERGLNFPDIALMEPLSELLELTVSELMAGERNAPAGEELVRTSVQMGKLVSGKARRWRRLFLALALVVVCLGGFFGYHWVKENTDWLPQRETMLLPREIEESEMMISHLMGNDLIAIMDTIWADDFYGFTFQLELWKGEKLLDTQRILAASGYSKDLGMRHGSLAFLMELDHQKNILSYSLMHGGAWANRVDYVLPNVTIQGWGRGVLTTPIEVDRETGTILACLSLDTGSGIRAIDVGNLEKPNVIEDQLAVVLRLVVE